MNTKGPVPASRIMRRGAHARIHARERVRKPIAPSGAPSLR